MILFYDVMRYVDAFAGVLVIGFTIIILICQPMPWDRRLRFGCLAAFGASIIGAYLSQLGTLPPQPWRFGTTTFGVIGTAVGLVPVLVEIYRDLAAAKTREARRHHTSSG